MEKRTIPLLECLTKGGKLASVDAVVTCEDGRLMIEIQTSPILRAHRAPACEPTGRVSPGLHNALWLGNRKN